MNERIRTTPKQMIEAVIAASSLPGAEPHKDALLDTIRLIASAVHASRQMRRKGAALEAQRNLIAKDAEGG